MKRLCKFFLTIFAAGFIFSSCATTDSVAAVSETDTEPIAADTTDIADEKTEPPQESFDEKSAPESGESIAEEPQSKGPRPVDFVHRGIKCEIEDMVLSGCQIVDDTSASGKKSTRWGTGSMASVDVNLPAGVFEILFSEKAFQTPGSHFFVTLGGRKFECFPSEPPLGTWELTLRTPLVFKIPEPMTLSISIESDRSYGYASQDFFLDYMQIVKTGD